MQRGGLGAAEAAHAAAETVARAGRAGTEPVPDARLEQFRITLTDRGAHVSAFVDRV